MEVLILAGSDGNNLKLANTLAEHLTRPVEVVNLVELNLPLYSTQSEKQGVSKEVLELSEKIKKAKALVVLAPEYNGSIPPVLTNAIAWVSRSGDEDWRSAFNNKFAVVGTHSGGGGQKVIQAMRTQLEHLGTTVLARSILTSYQKELNPESAQTILGQLESLV